MLKGDGRKHRLRPQDGLKLRELREKHHLHQSGFADKVNAHLRDLIPFLPASETLTQTQISDLELENSSLGILHLFAISDLFGVPPRNLLGNYLHLAAKSDIKTDSTSTSTSTSMGDGSFCVFPCFPSDPFIQADDEAFLQFNNRAITQEHVEFYPLDALVNFLFSPIGRDARERKIQILNRMQTYFRSSIYRRIYFVPGIAETRVRPPCISLAPDAGQVTFAFYDGSQTIRKVTVSNSQLCNTLQRHYQQEVELVHYGVVLLQVAHNTLSTEHSDFLAGIRFFYQQCVPLGQCADWVRSCFTPEVQQYLDEGNAVQS
jgi:transcriptional regulator with XRE-family HTH domain